MNRNDISKHIKVQPKSDDPEQTLKELQALEKMFYGANLVRKDSDASIATVAYSTAPTHWNPLFGRKVWSSLNYDQNVFAIIPKEPWKQSGWRMLVSAAQSSAHAGAEITGGIARGGNLPATISATPVTNSVQPKEIIHDFATHTIYDYMSSIEDSVQIMPFLREEIGQNHVAAINTMLVQSAWYLGKNSSGNWSGTNNFESLDRIISDDAEEDACGSSHTTYFDPWVTYGTTAIDRDSGTTYDAEVQASGGTLGTDGDLNLWDIEKLWRLLGEAVGKSPTDVILTGADTVSALSEILEPERRFVGEAMVYPTYGGVQGLQAGTEGAFSVSTYRGIPIVTSTVVRCTDATNGDTLSKMFFLDTDNLRLKIAGPTRYMESENGMTGFVANNALRIEAAYLTVGELICYRFNSQGKLRDIK